MVNLLQRFLEKESGRDLSRWDWTQLSLNPNITAEFVEKHLDWPWDWRYISEFKDPVLFERHPEILDSRCLWDRLSSNRRLKMEFFLRYPDKPWNWSRLSANPRIGVSLINHPKVNWDELSNNPSLTWELVKENLDKPLDWKSLLRHLDLSKVERELVPLTEQSFYYSISYNPTLDWRFVDTHLELPWNWGNLCYNPTLPSWFVQKHLSRLEDKLELFLRFPSVQKEPIYNQGIYLDEEFFLSKGYIDLASIRNYIQRSEPQKIAWGRISANPNLTWEFISEFEPSINRHWLSENKFFHDNYRLANFIWTRYRSLQSRKNSSCLILLKERLNVDLIIYIGDRFLW